MATLNRGKFRVRWTKDDGTRGSETFPKGTPKSKIDAFEFELKHGKLFKSLITGETRTFEEFASYWMTEFAHNYQTESTRIKTQITLNQHLLPSFGAMSVAEIRPKDVMALQNKMRDAGYAIQSINNTTASLSRILNDAVNEEIIHANPCKSVRGLQNKEEKARKIPPFWTFSETDRFLSYAQKADFETFQICALAVTSGLRPGEAKGLLRDSLDLDRNRIIVQRNWCTKTHRLNDYTKGKRDRIVPINRELLGAIGNKLDLRPEEFLFNFTSLSDFGFRKIKPLCEQAKVKYIGFHGLRHTFASHLAMRGVKVEMIKELMGHRSIQTTMIYIHIAEDHLAGMTDCLTKDMRWSSLSDTNVVLLNSGNFK